MYANVKDALLVFKRVDCNKHCKKNLVKDLAKRSENTYRFCHEQILSSVAKSAYSYKFMVSWQRFNETLLPEKKEFYINMTMKISWMLTTKMQEVFGRFLNKSINGCVLIYTCRMILYY